MKNKIALVCAIGLLAAGCDNLPPETAETEQAVVGVSLKTPPPLTEQRSLKAPQPQLLLLSVDQVEPTRLAEGRPVYFHFTFSNQTSRAHKGVVRATVTTQDGSLLLSNPWQVETPAGASAQGILEFEAPYAGPQVAYAVHYYDDLAPTVAAESTATSGTLAVAVRAIFSVADVGVVTASDNTFGDSDTAYLDETVNGSQVFAWSYGLGHLHNGASTNQYWNMPVVDLVPGTSDQATFTTRVTLTPNWGGVLYDGNGGGYSGFTVALRKLTLTGDTVISLLPHTPFDYLFMTDHFCNGNLTGLPCPRGSNEYTLTTSLERIGAFIDTVPMTEHVAQIHATQTYTLTPTHPASFAVISGGGTLTTINSQPVYIPDPNIMVPTLVRIEAIDSYGSSGLVFLGVRP